MKDVKTFGETLTKLMKNSNKTIEDIKNLVNQKNRTVISRILKDETKIQTIEEFYETFSFINPLQLSPDELKALKESLEVNRIGISQYLANKEMLSFVNKKNITYTFIRNYNYDEPPTNISNLSELFNSYQGYKRLKVCILNCVFDGIIDVLAHALDNSNNIFIDHYATREEDTYKNARQFISLLPIINFENYNFYQLPYSYNYKNTAQSNIIDNYMNMMIIFKETDKDEIFTDFISVEDNYHFKLLFNQTDINLYCFFNEIFDNMKNKSVTIKGFKEKQNLTENLIGISKQMLTLENANYQILIKPAFCYYSISADMLRNIFPLDTISEKDTNALYDLHEQRYKNYCKKGRVHIGIYSRDGIIEFMKTGRFSDHLPTFKNLSKAQIKESIESILNVSENSPFNAKTNTPVNAIHILKNDINYNQYQYQLFNDEILLFCDKSTDYDKANYNYITNCEQTVKALYKFINEILIPQYCYSHNDSVKIIRDLLKRYID